jgi:MFS transporter, PPP family, 3-phenylpropionic acid transporter
MKIRINQINALKHLLFWNGATVVIIGPFLPLYFFYKGYTVVQIGILLGVAPFMGVISQPFWAYLSDRYQSVKKILLIVFLLTIASSYGVFFGDSFTVILVFIILMYFFWSPVGPLLDSFIIQSIKNGNHTYGSLRLWASVGYAIFALIVGTILRVIGIQNLYVLCLVLFLVLIVSLAFVSDIKQITRKVEFKDINKLLGNRYLVWFLLLVMLLSIPNGFNGAILGIHLQNLGAKEDLIGLANTLAAASEVPVFYYLSRHLHKYREMFLLSIVGVLFTLRWAITAWISSPLVFTYFQITQSVTFAVLWLVALETMVKIVPEYLRSTGQALLTTLSVGVVSVFGSIFGAFVFQQYGAEMMYHLMAIITAIATILFYLTNRTQMNRKFELENKKVLQK